MKDSQAFSEKFLHHQHFGQLTTATQEQIKAATGCDFCWFAFLFDNHVRFRDFTRVATNPELGPFMWAISCLFINQNSQCPNEVRNFKKSLASNAVPKVSQFQYSNTPSCEDIDFGYRYWGTHYQKLLRIKSTWDPDNIFNHCQSVGSTDQYCCPY